MNRTKINSYLTFSGNCREAMTFYKEGDIQKITPSMLFTGKQFGKAEEAIKLYTSVFDKSSSDTQIRYMDGDPNAGKVMFSEFSLEELEMQFIMVIGGNDG